VSHFNTPGLLFFCYAHSKASPLMRRHGGLFFPGCAPTCLGHVQKQLPTHWKSLHPPLPSWQVTNPRHLDTLSWELLFAGEEIVLKIILLFFLTTSARQAKTHLLLQVSKRCLCSLSLVGRRSVVLWLARLTFGLTACKSPTCDTCWGLASPKPRPRISSSP